MLFVSIPYNRDFSRHKQTKDKRAQGAQGIKAGRVAANKGDLGDKAVNDHEKGGLEVTMCVCAGAPLNQRVG